MKDILSSVKVPVCLGTTQFGDKLSEAEAHHQLDLFTDLGGTLVDTAFCYGGWAPNGFEGMVEQIMGRWLAVGGHREKIILITKGAHPHKESMDVRRVTPQDIATDIENSLKNLQTDHIDLYLLHRDDPTKPVEPILQALEQAVKAGKILHYGCSNWSLGRMQEAACIANANNLSGFEANQLRWSLAAPNPRALADKTMMAMDADTYHWHKETGMPAMAYTSLAHGYLMHKLMGRPVSESREASYGNATNDHILQIVKDSGADMMALSMRYIAQQSFASIPVASFSSDAQMQQAVAAALDDRYDDVLAQIAEIRNAVL